MKRRQEECKKAPINLKHYSKIRAARFSAERGAPTPAPCAVLSQVTPLSGDALRMKHRYTYSVSWKIICFPSSRNLRENYY